MTLTVDDRFELTKVVALINGKGGVGKTTLTSGIGGMLAASGWKVLLVDMDPQGNLALDLGIAGTDADDEGRGLAMALQYRVPLSPTTEVRPNLDVVVGGDLLDPAELYLRSMGAKVDPRLALAEALAPITRGYDIVLVDCPPGNKGLQRAAAGAAKALLIPTRTDSASIEGMRITASIKNDIQDVNPGLELLGVVLFASQTSSVAVRRSAAEDIRRTFGVEDADAVLFSSFVRFAEATARATRSKGKLSYEVERDVKNGPTWWQRRRTGEKLAAAGPRSASAVSDDMQEVVTEFIERYERIVSAVGSQA